MSRKIEINEQEKAYFAGILDGEGYIGAHTTAKDFRYKYNDIRVTIGLKYEAGILYRLRDIYGGNLRLDKHGMFYWNILGLAAEVFLRDLYPYIKIKKRQLELALELRKTKIYRGGRVPKVPDNILNKRLEIGDRIKSYNQNTGFGYQQVIN